MRLLKMQFADKQTLSRYVPSDDHPTSQYFHSRTKLPMCGGDWEDDSDDEPDDTWLDQMSEMVSTS